MTFKAILKCDADGCCNEFELDCAHPADAEIRYDEINDDTNWLVDFETDEHYCPNCAPKAMKERM
ncbi:hypothetical protein [Vibrio sp.]|uniref:hypothetical protein n=1 Tax=Vibrio sp. TaxID=678 RepID=UPI003AA972E8